MSDVKSVDDLMIKAQENLSDIIQSEPNPAIWSQRALTSASMSTVAIEQSYKIGSEIKPPAGFQGVHVLWLKGLKKYADAMPIFRQGVDGRNSSKLLRALQLITEGGNYISQATAELDKINSSTK